jgi:hypothetical protein
MLPGEDLKIAIALISSFIRSLIPPEFFPG